MHFGMFLSILLVATLVGSLPAGSFNSKEVTIDYHLEGKKDGESVILLHGWMSCGEDLLKLEFAKRLATDYRLVVPDLRGCGRSDKPRAVNEYGVKMVKDVVRLMDHLDIERSHVIGYSMGGFIAAKLIADHPTRVKSAVIGGNGGFRKADMSPSIEAFSKSVGEEKSTFEAITETGPLAGFPPNPNLKDSKSFRERLDRTDPRAVAAVALGWRQLAVSDRDLRRIAIPTLVIRGEHENRSGIESTDRFHELVRSCTKVVLPGEYHESVPLTKAFSVRVRAFIDEVDRASKREAKIP